MKKKIKILLNFIYNFSYLYRLKSKGKNLFIDRNAHINKPKFVEIGDNVRIGKNLKISVFTKFNNEQLFPQLKIASRCYIGDNFKILLADKVCIEENVLIASDVLITSENHGINPEDNLSYGKQSLLTGTVNIKEGCWIGEKVIILPKVTIGKKSIVAAGSIVTKSVPDYSIVAGNPARIIKQYNFKTKEWEKK